MQRVTYEKVLPAIARRHIASKVRDACEAVISECNHALLLEVQDASTAVDAGGEVLYTAKANRVFDQGKFMAAHADIAAQCMRLDSSAASSSPRKPAAVTTLPVCHRRRKRSG